MAPPMAHLLLPSYKSHAMPYRTPNATRLPATCGARSTNVSAREHLPSSKSSTHLCGDQDLYEPVFPHGSEPNQEYVQDREVCRLRLARVGVYADLDEPQRRQNLEHERRQWAGWEDVWVEDVKSKMTRGQIEHET